MGQELGDMAADGRALRAQMLAAKLPMIELALVRGDPMACEAILSLPLREATDGEIRSLFAHALHGALARDWSARFERFAEDEKNVERDADPLEERERFEEEEHNLTNEQMAEMAHISRAAAAVARGRPAALAGMLDCAQAMAEAASRSHAHFMDMDDDAMPALESSRLMQAGRRSVCGPLILLAALSQEGGSPPFSAEELGRVGLLLSPWIDMRGPAALSDDGRELFAGAAELAEAWFGDPDFQDPSPALTLEAARRAAEALELSRAAAPAKSSGSRPRM